MMNKVSTAALLLAVILTMAVVAAPLLLILMFGLAPSWVTLMADRSPGRLRSQVMLTMNIAGAAPFLYRVWADGMQMMTATVILTDTYAWLAMYGAAALSVALLWMGPPLAAGYYDLTARTRLAKLRYRRRQIIREWGEEAVQQSQQRYSSSVLYGAAS